MPTLLHVVTTNPVQLYADLGQDQKALDYYNQALPLWRDAQREFEAANGREVARTMRATLAQMKA